MTDVLDPTIGYALLFILVIATGAGLGLQAGADTGILGSIVILGIIGFSAGRYTARESTDIAGSLALTGGFAALVAWFLPLHYLWGIAVFLVTFITGMRHDPR